MSIRSFFLLWKKYKSNFPGIGTEPIQKHFGKLEMLSDALVLNRNEFSIF